MEVLSHSLGIIKYNIKLCFGLNYIAAFLFAASAFFFFDLKYMSMNDVSQIGELFLSITGIIMLPSIIHIEESENANEAVFTKRTPYYLTIALRMLITFATLALVLFIIIFYCKINSGSFDLLKVWSGIYISALYLGIAGITAVNITKELVPGYLVSLGYFAFEFFTHGKYTSAFYAFSLVNNDYSPKLRILAIIIILISINLILVKKRS